MWKGGGGGQKWLKMCVIIKWMPPYLSPKQVSGASSVSKRRSQLFADTSNRDVLSTYSSAYNSNGSNNNSTQTATAGLSYEDRINLALGRKPVGAVAAGKQTLTSAVGGQYDPYTNVTQPYASGGSGATSSAVQKSKSYSNFDSVRRDFSYGQVESVFA